MDSYVRRRIGFDELGGIERPTGSAVPPLISTTRPSDSEVDAPKEFGRPANEYNRAAYQGYAARRGTNAASTEVEAENEEGPPE